MEKKLIFQGPDGRELSQEEAMDLAIQDVRIDQVAGTITLELTPDQSQDEETEGGI